MAQRRVNVQDIGEVILSKRRGSTHIRLSINTKGQVRVGMPFWTPYEAGLLFLKSKKDWVKRHMADNSPFEIKNGNRIGKTHIVEFINAPAGRGYASSRVTATAIRITTTLSFSDPRVQNRAVEACEKALHLEASQLLPPRVNSISQRYNLGYNSLKIRKLTSRWGSCSAKKNISLSYFLIQLPWELVDYVILHELAHTEVLRHGPEFWDLMEERLPNVRELRKLIKQHKPKIVPR